MSKGEEIRLAHLKKTLKKLPPLSDDQLESLDSMTRAIVSKILKDPLLYLKANGNGRHSELVRELEELRSSS